jgi:hypothetical protein
MITMEMIAANDTNGDDVINPEDVIDADHYATLVAECDSNDDGSIDMCEMHACVVATENAWRANECPFYGDAYCPCESGPVCEGAWTCQ